MPAIAAEDCRKRRRLHSSPGAANDAPDESRSIMIRSLSRAAGADPQLRLVQACHALWRPLERHRIGVALMRSKAALRAVPTFGLISSRERPLRHRLVQTPRKGGPQSPKGDAVSEQRRWCRGYRLQQTSFSAVPSHRTIACRLHAAVRRARPCR